MLQKFACLILLCISFIGCANKELTQARSEFYNNRPFNAYETLSKEQKTFPKNEKLLFFMEKGLILHHLANYEESTKYFLEASNLIEQQDIISISQQASSLIINEWTSEYKGEYSERLWVHTYLIMNYLLLYKYEDALVEAKQALKILNKYSEALSYDFFTQALIALCFENLLEIDNAYLTCKNLAKFAEINLVASELHRLGTKLGFYEDVKKYEKLIYNQKHSLLTQDSESELILFIGIGKSPIKISGNIIVPPLTRISFPNYKNIEFENKALKIYDSNNLSYIKPNFAISTNVNLVASKSLSLREKEVILKEGARVATKEVIAHSVEQKNQALGILTRLVFSLTEEADTRCWETLPAFFQLIKIPIKSGKHNLKISFFAQNSKNEFILPEFEVKRKQKVYKSIRII